MAGPGIAAGWFPHFTGHRGTSWQDTSGAGTTGGGVQIRPGMGTSASGTLSLLYGNEDQAMVFNNTTIVTGIAGTIHHTLSATSSEWNVPTIRFAAGVTTPIFAQDDNTIGRLCALESSCRHTPLD